MDEWLLTTWDACIPEGFVDRSLRTYRQHNTLGVETTIERSTVVSWIIFFHMGRTYIYINVHTRHVHILWWLHKVHMDAMHECISVRPREYGRDQWVPSLATCLLGFIILSLETMLIKIFSFTPSYEHNICRPCTFIWRCEANVIYVNVYTWIPTFICLWTFATKETAGLISSLFWGTLSSLSSWDMYAYTHRNIKDNDEVDIYTYISLYKIPLFQLDALDLASHRHNH